MGEYDGEDKVVEVFGDQHAKDTRAYTDPAYTRTIHKRAVTFTCQRCGQTVTQRRYPGAWPLYCSAACQDEARREATRERVQRWRERRKQGQEEP